MNMSTVTLRIIPYGIVFLNIRPKLVILIFIGKELIRIGKSRQYNLTIKQIFLVYVKEE